MQIKISWCDTSWMVDFPELETVDPFGKYAGVYLITCRANGRRYIGSSKDVISRLMSHLSMLNLHHHHNKALQRDALQFGIGQFNCQIVTLCPPRERLFWEQAVILHYEPEYNPPE